jgi:Xaa-Pro aminopeptidase
VDGYTADETRMFVIGNLSSDLKDAFKAALAIQDELVKMAVPGVECGELYEKAVSLAEGFGMAGHFMGMGSEGVRFVGHGVGLELDEWPIFAKGVKMKLEPGMTFAIEPKFVFSDGAIGIENTFVMENGGVQVLTHASQKIVSVSWGTL